jgi:CRP/FNR family transcriptional regulator, cyclic AMP receptor protein
MDVETHPMQPEGRTDLAIVAAAFACSSDVAAQIVMRGHQRQFASGRVILRQGDWLALAYLLITGRARAWLYGVEGQHILLHEFSSGDLFGAICDIDTVPQDADVVAIEEVEAFSIQAVELAQLAERYGVIGLALSRMLMTRLRQMSARMYERVALSAVGRVYAEVLREAEQCPDLRIEPAPVISELALRVSTTRETASRAISALERRGIIRRDAASLTVVAPHRLRDLIV